MSFSLSLSLSLLFPRCVGDYFGGGSGCIYFSRTILRSLNSIYLNERISILKVKTHSNVLEKCTLLRHNEQNKQVLLEITRVSSIHSAHICDGI